METSVNIPRVAEGLRIRGRSPKQPPGIFLFPEYHPSCRLSVSWTPKANQASEGEGREGKNLDQDEKDLS
ncbi:hypothetical protein HNY73_011873 [Argiope bruennichi]|uniref:Uncharacterized protein n=1 Tax=Argiope bruennichi TaxID=94029 RepID=A0A8T0EUR6_ARGBR|nr:hypothetical protein HNY73_011873 [Argiope bruennichi]